MRTTLDLPEDLIEEVQELSKSKTKTEAIILVLSEYKKRRKLELLAEQLGTFDNLISPKELKKLQKK